MKRLLTVTVLAVSLVGMAACSDSPSSTIKNLQSTTISPGTGGTTVTIPNIAGIPAECKAIIEAIAGAGAAATGGSSTDQAKAVFQALVTAVPDSLKADAQTFANAYSGYLDLLASYNGDPSKAMQDPKVLAALQAMNTPAVQAATQHLTDYMDSTCPHS